MKRSEPKQARLNEQEQAAFDTIEQYLNDNMPPGGEVNDSLVIRYALIMAAASIRQEAQAPS